MMHLRKIFIVDIGIGSVRARTLASRLRTSLALEAIFVIVDMDAEQTKTCMQETPLLQVQVLKKNSVCHSVKILRQIKLQPQKNKGGSSRRPVFHRFGNRHK